MHLRPTAAGRLEAHANLDALDRLHCHHGLRKPSVELAIPLGVGAEADRQARNLHFDDASERIALLTDPVDETRHVRITSGEERIDGARITDRAEVGGRPALETILRAAKHDAAEFPHPARNLDAKHSQQLPGERSGGHASGGLAGAGPLEHSPHAPEVFDAAGQIGMAGAGPLHVVEPLELGVAVDHLERQRAPERDAPP